ncbi:MAG: hypothetical protein DMF68_03835 [Acidobacteria bacterium]|nr:MAG: hypothetical protein DMF68_03835 [Acidobacteriota bacterium]
MHVFKRKKRKARSLSEQRAGVSAWASVGMRLTFRAEVMPGRERDQRTFIVAHVLTSGRVELHGLVGQHSETEFEPVS